MNNRLADKRRNDLLDLARFWPEAERTTICTCGLIAAGWQGSWVVAHVRDCHVTVEARRLFEVTNQ